jgi:uncharacterized membrane protein YadS
VVQAVGAAAAGGAEAAQSGTVMKLARVVLLAPAILALGWFLARGTGKAGVAVPVPWFAFGFLALVLARSAGIVPAIAIEASRHLVPLMLAASVAALGISTDLRIVRQYGARPLLLGVASTVFITTLAVVGVMAAT